MLIAVDEQYVFQVPNSPQVVAPQEQAGHLIFVCISPWVINSNYKG